MRQIRKHRSIPPWQCRKPCGTVRPLSSRSSKVRETGRSSILRSYTIWDATQLILYAVDREQRTFYVKLAWEPCTGRWAEPVPITQDNILGYCALHGKVLNLADATTARYSYAYRAQIPHGRGVADQ